MFVVFNKCFHIWITVFISLTFPFQVYANELSLLNDCDDVSQMWKLTNVKNPWAYCDVNAGKLLSALGYSQIPFSQNKTCFIKSPVSSLTEFDCSITASPEHSNSLLCARYVPLGTIDNFKKSHEISKGKISSNYISSASKCKVSNGDAAVTQSTNVPPYLQLNFSHGFGFGLSLGEGLPSEGVAFHGVVKSKNSVRGQFPEVEYFNIFRGTPALSKRDKGKLINGVYAKFERDIEFSSFLESFMTQPGTYAGVNVLSIEITPENLQKVHKYLAKDISYVIEDVLGDSGLLHIKKEDMSDVERDVMERTAAELTSTFDSGNTTANRSVDFEFFEGGKDQICSHYNGTFNAFTFILSEEDGASNSIGLLIIGTNHCISDAKGNLGNYLIASTKKSIEDYLMELP